MDLNIVFTSALVSGFVSSAVGFFVSIRLKSVDFRFSYKKYILDKRVHVYEEIEKIVSQFHPGADNHFTIFFEESYDRKNKRADFETPLKLIESVLERNLWIEKKTIKILEDLKFFYRDVLAEIEKEIPVEKRVPYMQRFVVLSTTLSKEYFDDVKKMDRVRRFIRLKSKINEESFNDLGPLRKHLKLE
jgi:hypothetical protein